MSAWTPEDEIRALAAFDVWHGPLDFKAPCMPTHPHLSGAVYEREKDAFIAGVRWAESIAPTDPATSATEETEETTCADD